MFTIKPHSLDTIAFRNVFNDHVLAFTVLHQFPNTDDARALQTKLLELSQPGIMAKGCESTQSE